MDRECAEVIKRKYFKGKTIEQISFRAGDSHICSGIMQFVGEL